MYAGGGEERNVYLFCKEYSVQEISE